MPSIDKVTIATRDTEAMLGFYERVLGVVVRRAEPVSSGTLAELAFVFCPREIAGVDAEQNTIQLRFVVPDLEESVRRALAAGGRVIDPVAESGGRRTASVRDPDGNSVELAQR